MISLGAIKPTRSAERQTCAQGRVNFGHLTVEENLRLAGFGLRRGEVKARLAQLRESDSFLDARWRARVGDLSGGQQQFVEVAMALVNQLSVLSLGQPSLGLSPAARTAVLARARATADDGTCVFVVEQNVRAAAPISDRIVVLDRGSIVLDGTPGDLLDDPRLRAVYVGTVGERSPVTAARDHSSRTSTACP